MSPLTSAPFLVDTYVSTDMLFLHYICFRLLESGETTSKFYDLSTAKKRTYSLLEEGSSMPKAPEDIVVAERMAKTTFCLASTSIHLVSR